MRRTWGGRVVALGACHVEGVHLTAGGVLGRDVERVEIVPVALDLRAFGDREAHIGEDSGDLLGDLAHGVDRTLRHRAGGQRDVEGLGGEAGLEGGVGEPGAGLGEGGVQVVLQGVERRAGGLALLRGHPAELAHHQRDLALLAERGKPHLLDGGLVARRGDGCEITLAKGDDAVHVSRPVRHGVAAVLATAGSECKLTPGRDPRRWRRADTCRAAASAGRTTAARS